MVSVRVTERLTLDVSFPTENTSPSAGLPFPSCIRVPECWLSFMGSKKAFVILQKTCFLKIGWREKNPPYLMMLFQRSRALMMIIIIINGTARELTNNGEQMIPSWPQKKKKSLYACRKLNRSFPGNLKLRCLSRSQLVVFLFLCGELKVHKSNYV